MIKSPGGVVVAAAVSAHRVQVSLHGAALLSWPRCRGFQFSTCYCTYSRHFDLDRETGNPGHFGSKEGNPWAESIKAF